MRRTTYEYKEQPPRGTCSGESTKATKLDRDNSKTKDLGKTDQHHPWCAPLVERKLLHRPAHARVCAHTYSNKPSNMSVLHKARRDQDVAKREKCGFSTHFQAWPSAEQRQDSAAPAASAELALAATSGWNLQSTTERLRAGQSARRPHCSLHVVLQRPPAPETSTTGSRRWYGGETLATFLNAREIRRLTTRGVARRGAIHEIPKRPAPRLRREDTEVRVSSRPASVVVDPSPSAFDFGRPAILWEQQ